MDLHPSRISLLIDLIETQVSKGYKQVVVTTHSSNLLSIIGEETFENTSVYFGRGYLPMEGKGFEFGGDDSMKMGIASQDNICMTGR